MFKFLEEVGQVIEVQIKDHGIKSCKTLFLLLLLLLSLFCLVIYFFAALYCFEFVLLL